MACRPLQAFHDDFNPAKIAKAVGHFIGLQMQGGMPPTSFLIGVLMSAEIRQNDAVLLEGVQHNIW